MIDTDKCQKCGEVETTKHLLWECPQVRNIWSIFNNLMVGLKKQVDTVNSYDEVYSIGSTAGTNLIKIKLIQELIQIDRPKYWDIDNMRKIIVNLTDIEKYNSVKTYNKALYAVKWGFLNKYLNPNST